MQFFSWGHCTPNPNYDETIELLWDILDIDLSGFYRINDNVKNRYNHIHMKACFCVCLSFWWLEKLGFLSLEFSTSFSKVVTYTLFYLSGLFGFLVIARAWRKKVLEIYYDAPTFHYQPEMFNIGGVISHYSTFSRNESVFNHSIVVSQSKRYLYQCCYHRGSIENTLLKTHSVNLQLQLEM